MLKGLNLAPFGAVPFLFVYISLIGIALYRIFQYFQTDAGLLEHVAGFLCRVVTEFGHHVFDAAADNQHGAHPAGLHFAIQGAAFQGNTVPGGLADGVLFGVDSSHTMLASGAVIVDHLFHQVADIVAVRQAGRRADIACRNDPFIPDNNAARAAAVAGGPGGNGVHHVNKVVVPIWSHGS